MRYPMDAAIFFFSVNGGSEKWNYLKLPTAGTVMEHRYAVKEKGRGWEPAKPDLLKSLHPTLASTDSLD